MPNVRWSLVIIYVLFFSVFGCGSSNDVGTGTYAEKCAVACKLPTSEYYASCTDEDFLACRKECEVLTEGLKTECAQCLIENSNWSYHPVFSDGGVVVPSKECPRYSFEETSSSKCKDFCK
jgi:hypothetical protein